MCKIFIAIFVVGVVADVKGASEGADFSHGLHLLGKFVKNYVDSLPGDVKIADGVHLTSSKSENDARSFNNDGSVIGSIENYLKSHEIRIKLPELLPEEGFGRAFKDAVEGVTTGSVGTARGKGGKGGGYGGIMIMGMMMGKMMAALGLGGVGLLAMKALMISALALMLSMIIGIKKLVSSHDDEGGHTVIHASHGHDHHRRKREAADMAYRSWAEYQQ